MPPIEQLGELQIPQSVPVRTGILAPTLKDAPAFVRDVIGKMLVGRGDQVPGSALPVDGGPALIIAYSHCVARKATPAEAKPLFQKVQKNVNTRWQLAKKDSTPKKTQ